MKGKNRGFTLIELGIYAFLLVVVLGVVFRMSVMNRRQMEKPAASYRIQQNLIAVNRWITRDLRETNLATVRIYPNPDNTSAPPGISIASPRRISDDKIINTPWGTPHWQKIIYYTLQKDPTHPGMGILIRKEGTIPTLPAARPAASDFEPSVAPAEQRKTRVIAKNIMLPGESIPELNLNPGNAGGFEASFIDENGSKSLKYSHTHPIININLISKETSDATGNKTIMPYQIRVVPEN